MATVPVENPATKKAELRSSFKHVTAALVS